VETEIFQRAFNYQATLQDDNIYCTYMSLLEVVEEARPYRVQASCIRLRPEIERG
jgi:hypothetical protein